MNAARKDLKRFNSVFQPLPDATRGRRNLLGLGRLSLRIALALTALAVLSSPFTLAFYLHYKEQWIGPRLDTAPARQPLGHPFGFREASMVANRAPRAEPIVLAYHNIAWNSKSQYAVTPPAFEAEMAMLHAAGYHTLTARQLVNYIHGGTAPSPSVAITFDDGPRGLWTYADKVLARYHFHGISFLITSRVGTQQPDYLTWQEIQLMYSSGRWDFESNTDDLHQKVPISASGRLGDPMTQLVWLPYKHRKESMAEFRARVHNDLDKSITAITANHLPRPYLFAYPFAGSRGSPPNTSSGYANSLIRKLFAAAMTSYVTPPVALSHREAASGVVSRLEVTSATTTEMLLSGLREIAGLPVADMSNFDKRTYWEALDGNAADVTIAGRDVLFKSKHSRWAYAAFAPGATADWHGYRITVEITGLSYQANSTATISVRLGSAAQLNIGVANHYLKVRLGGVRTRKIALAKRLPASSAHRVTIQVKPATTIVFIDGQVIMRKPVVHGPSSTGGFAVSSFRSDTKLAFPRFTDIDLKQLAS